LSLLPVRAALANWMRNSLPTDSYADAVNLADHFRYTNFKSLTDPLTSLPEILVGLGGLILGRMSTSRFEGASIVADGYAFIFVSPRFSGRMLFTLAHELGHLLAHHSDNRSSIFDLSSQIGSFKRTSNVESFADAFASALLMPRNGVGIALNAIRSTLDVREDALGDIEVLYLAIFYGVSFEVAARRCEQLELLPSGGAYSLSQHVKAAYGSAEKLARKLSLPPRAPIRIPQVSENVLDAAIAKIDEGEVSIGWVTDRFGCSVSEIYATRERIEKNRGNMH